MHTGAALIAALCVMVVSLVGVIFTSARFGAWMRKYLTYLATFSAGVFLLIAYHLSQEAVEEGGWLIGLGAVLLGAALMEGIHYLLPTEHHHHGHSHDHAHTHIDGRRVLFSDALHNVGDGIMLVGAFAASVPIGIAATVGVLLHEAVQEISEYFVLREAGYSNRSALTRNFTVSATILIGVAAATVLASSEIILALLAGIAAGGFLSVVFHDLIPHAVHAARTHGGAYIHISVGLVGAAAMLGLQAQFPEPGHAEESEASETVPATQVEETFENLDRATTPATPTRESSSPAANPAQSAGSR
jgi:zinc and cadmium transporter